MDQGTSQNLATLEPFDLERVEVDQGKRLNAEQLAAAGVYQRYAFTDDGVSPYTVPGTPGGMSLVTGNERDEFGRVSTDRINRTRMVDKRALKLERALDDLPAARRYGDPAAPIGLVAIGAVFGPTLEAMEELESRGITNQFLQPRTVWPVLEETLEFVAQCERIYVVEQNATGQLAKLLVREGAESAKIRNVLRYDGTPLRSGHIVQDVLAQEAKS
jgi:2-oxoglutarate ferredoxin oxidoreductase subunit alpha